MKGPEVPKSSPHPMVIIFTPWSGEAMIYRNTIHNYPSVFPPQDRTRAPHLPSGCGDHWTTGAVGLYLDNAAPVLNKGHVPYLAQGVITMALFTSFQFINHERS